MKGTALEHPLGTPVGAGMVEGELHGAVGLLPVFPSSQTSVGNSKDGIAMGMVHIPPFASPHPFAREARFQNGIVLPEALRAGGIIVIQLSASHPKPSRSCKVPIRLDSSIGSLFP